MKIYKTNTMHMKFEQDKNFNDYLTDLENSYLKK